MWSGGSEFDREMEAFAVSDAERLQIIHMALKERGYAPVNQIVGFLLTGDPTYITNHNGARSLAGRINRTELLAEIVSYYLAGVETQSAQAKDNGEACECDSIEQTASVNLKELLTGTGAQQTWAP